MSARACVFLADGCEEVEALTPVDYLRRAGIEVTMAGVSGRMITGARGIRIETDCLLEEATFPFDCLVIPGGGKGAENLAADPRVVELARDQASSGRLLAAICAAPAIVLHEACGLLAGRRFTCFPGLESRVTGASFLPDRVVRDGALITARAAGCSGEFARAIIEALMGGEAGRELAERVLL